MKSSKQLVVGLVAILLALTAGVLIGLEAQGTRTRLATPDISGLAVTQLFAARMYDSEGKMQPLAQWKGKILVINFWASWCAPCREEMPSFSRLQTKYSTNSVQFVGIALDSADNVVKFSKQHPSSYPLLIADTANAGLTQQLGNIQQALPYTVVINANGQVQLAQLGRITEQELDKLLQKLAKDGTN